MQAFSVALVPHNILVEFAQTGFYLLLYRFSGISGIFGRLLAATCSFAAGSSQIFEAGLSFSDLSPIPNGVPKVTMLGLLLFPTYTSDTPCNFPGNTVMDNNDATIRGT